MNWTVCSNLMVRPEPLPGGISLLEDDEHQQKVVSITIPFIFFGVAA